MQCIFAAAKGLPAAVRSLRWGVGEFGLEEVEVAGDLGVLGAAAAGDAVQVHALARDGDAFELVACADGLRQAAADGERVRRADDAAARIALVHHDPVAIADLVGRADGGIAVSARGELLVLYIGIGLEQPVVERLGVGRQLCQQRVAAAQIEAGGDLVEKMQLEILILHGLLGRGEHTGRDERRDDVELHVGQRADAAVGGDIDAFEFRGRAVPVLLRQADKRLDRGGKALHAEPQPADPALRPDGIELLQLRENDLRMLQKPLARLRGDDAAVSAAEDLIAELLLERAEHTAGVRLRKIEIFGRLGDGAGPGGLHGSAQLLDGHSLPSSP